MYTIKRAADLTGVPEATLRAWERRYGMVRPERTDGGYRVYDDDDLDRLRQMRDLVAQGWAPRQAAEQVRPGPSGGQPPATDEFVAAAAAGDVVGLRAVLQQASESASCESFVQDWLLPAVSDLGVAWSRGEVSVGGEHLAAHTVMRHLAGVFEAAGRHSVGQRVLVGLPAGARHEIGAFAFATLARRRGLDVRYAGADLPVGDWVGLAGQDELDAAVVCVPMSEDAAAAQETVDALRAAHPRLLVAAGGGHQEQVEGALRLGHLVGRGVDELVLALQAS